MKRITEVVPGYDCRTECKHTPKGNHGICSDRWWYVVVADEGDCALSLKVSSQVYPPTVVLDRKDPAWGIDLTCHAAFPVSTEQLLAESDKCQYVASGRCYVASSTCLGAKEFFEQHGDPSKQEQPEPFWTAFEALAARKFAEAREADVSKTHQRCSCCNGRGYVRKGKADAD